VAITVVTGLTVVGAAAQERPSASGKPPVRLVVLFDRTSSDAEQDRAVDGAGSELRSLASLDARVLEVPGSRAREVFRRLREDGSVRSVEIDAVRRADVIPNDPAVDSAFQPTLDRVDLHEAWDHNTGASSTVIAVIDTGVDGIAPDLPRSRFVSPHNVLTGTSSVGDVDGHGTAVASIAAMAGNNDQLAAGACWSCSIMPVKALDSEGFGLASDVATGIVWAVQHGADVINLSLSGPASGIEKRAVDLAEANGVVVVAAAGNQGGSTPRYPAAHATVLGVAASGTGSDARESYSNFGDWVKVAAPGTNAALDAGNANAVLGIQGTSSASPVVAGIAGLLRSENPGLSPAQIRSALMGSAVDVAYVSSSGGRVDADAAMAAIGAGLTTPPGPTTGPNPTLELNPTDEFGGGVSSSGSVTKTVPGVRAGPATFRAICAFCGGLTVEIFDNAANLVASQSGGRDVTVSTNLGNGTYRFRLRGQRGGLVRFLITYSQ
jgi:subtilisin family serine protease